MFYTHDFYDKLNKEGFEFIKNPIQFNDILTAFWLQSAHAKTMDFTKYTNSLQKHSLIVKSKMEVEIVSMRYQSFPGEMYVKDKSFNVAAINMQIPTRIEKDQRES